MIRTTSRCEAGRPFVAEPIQSVSQPQTDESLLTVSGPNHGVLTARWLVPKLFLTPQSRVSVRVRASRNALVVSRTNWARVLSAIGIGSSGPGTAIAFKNL